MRPPDTTVPTANDKTPDFAALRAEMVEQQLVRRGITDARVLAAMGAVPREAFVDERFAGLAYRDAPLPIEARQTISQPYVVAHMLELAAIRPGDTVLDVGTGSGYAAAVAGKIARRVVGIERHEVLANAARERLAALGYDNVVIHCGDGSKGVPAEAPFNAILVAAAGAEVPQALLDQLAPGGRLVMPVGRRGGQVLKLVQRRADGGYEESLHGRVAFVPLVVDKS